MKKRSFGRVSDPLKKASKPVGPNRTLAILATRFPRADLFRCSEFLGLDRTLTCRACHQQLAARRKEARDTQSVSVPQLLRCSGKFSLFPTRRLATLPYFTTVASQSLRYLTSP